jgi:hypothetical protein
MSDMYLDLLAVFERFLSFDTVFPWLRIINVLRGLELVESGFRFCNDGVDVVSS